MKDKSNYTKNKRNNYNNNINDENNSTQNIDNNTHYKSDRNKTFNFSTKIVLKLKVSPVASFRLSAQTLI